MTIDVKKRKIKIDRYFKVEFGNTDKSFDEVVKDISTAMKDSTEHHLISDVEVGSFLSSGVDLSLIHILFILLLKLRKSRFFVLESYLSMMKLIIIYYINMVYIYVLYMLILRGYQREI